MVSLAFLAVYCVTAKSEMVSYVALGSNFALESYFHFGSFQICVCDKLQCRGQVQVAWAKDTRGTWPFLTVFFPLRRI